MAKRKKKIVHERECVEHMRSILLEGLEAFGADKDLHGAPYRWKSAMRDAGVGIGQFPTGEMIRDENWGSWSAPLSDQFDNASPAQIATYFYELAPHAGKCSCREKGE